MDEQPEPSTEGLTYPASVQSLRGEPLASAFLADWVQHGLSLARQPEPPTPPILEALSAPLREFSRSLGLERDEPAVPQIHPESGRENSKWIQMLGRSELWLWIYVASHDDDIARHYGKSERRYDDASKMLLSEAFAFLNDMLARHHALGRMQRFSRPMVLREAASFWTGLAVGQVSFEIGTFVGGLMLGRGIDDIALGPRARLRRIQGHWAAERFKRADRIPPGWCAVTTTVSKPYTPGEKPDFEITRSINEDKQRAFNEALTVLRLIQPDVIFLEEYRLSCLGHRIPPELGDMRTDLREDVDQVRQRIMLPIEEQRSLIEMGKFALSTPDDKNLFDVEITGRLGLAVRTYNSAINRRQWQDKIVELSTTLELLLIRTAGEIDYKVCVRTAMMIGCNTEESKAVFDAVDNLYEVRSTIVHGNPRQLGQGLRKNLESLLKAWAGEDLGIPTEIDRLGARAARAATELVSTVLLAFMRLEAEKNPDLQPFGSKSNPTGFLRELDTWLFDPEARRAIQRRAVILRCPAVGSAGQRNR